MCVDITFLYSFCYERGWVFFAPSADNRERKGRDSGELASWKHGGHLLCFLNSSYWSFSFSSSSPSPFFLSLLLSYHSPWLFSSPEEERKLIKTVLVVLPLPSVSESAHSPLLFATVLVIVFLSCVCFNLMMPLESWEFVTHDS